MRKLKLFNERIIQIIEDKEVSVVHYPNALGDDRTLCGMALEGMGRKSDSGDDWHSASTKTPQNVTCSKCIQIATFCKNI